MTCLLHESLQRTHGAHVRGFLGLIHEHLDEHPGDLHHVVAILERNRRERERGMFTCQIRGMGALPN